MIWKVEYSSRARRDLRRLERQIAQRIVRSIRRHVETESGDVKALRASDYDYRLRVGDWRVLFDKDESTRTMEVGRILHRREAYRR